MGYNRHNNIKPVITFTTLILLLVLLVFLDLFLGSVHIPPREIVNILFHDGPNREEWDIIIMQFRLPKAAVAILAGIALSVSGLQMQTIFRNPLAGPFVLGISSGASLGVAILVLGFSTLLPGDGLNIPGNWSLVIASWVGAGFILLIILGVSARIRDIMTILILGIMFSSAVSAIVSILQYFSHESQLKSFVIWSMGSLGHVTNEQLLILFPGIMAGLLLSFIAIKPLNAFLLGENYARSIGINIQLSRYLIFISTSLLAGSITAFCGPIGFIGIAVPHISRLIMQSADHKKLLPATVLSGACIMLLSDIISQLPGHEQNIPVNSVTSLIGIPVVIWVIISNKKINLT